MTQKHLELFNFDFSAFAERTEWLIGIDEAGRGPLAGPVHAAGVAIRRSWYEASGAVSIFSEVNDSKQLSASKREFAYSTLMDQVYPGGPVQIAVCTASVREIDEINILEATKLAMFRVLKELEPRLNGLKTGLQRQDDSMFELGERGGAESKILVDGLPLKHFPYVHRSLVKGDGKSLCIALASIAAKVERDAWMLDCDEDYPAYGWRKNKGYGTKQHRDALLEIGPCEHHRKTFVKGILGSA